MESPNQKQHFATGKKSKGGLCRLWNAFKYSYSGFYAAFKHEHACRQEILTFIPLCILVFVLPVDGFSKALLILPMPMILCTEMINSAIEAVVDDISLEYRELAKRAKDFGSAAVFCSILVGLILWIAVIADNVASGAFDAWAAYLKNIFAR